MSTVLHSILFVAITEIGDKTQLLAFILASRFRKPWVILAGILAATVLNHGLAASLGSWIAKNIAPEHLRWGLAVVFLLFSVWILFPDKEEEHKDRGRLGAFFTTFITFFLAETGDKTQLATLALAAKYQDIILVTAGTTLGMLLADGPAVFFGEKITKFIPLQWIRTIAAVLFVMAGVGVFLGY